MPSKLRIPLLPGALVCILAAQGCSQFDLTKDIPWPMGDADNPKAPTKVVAIWTETVLTQVGQPSKRGFGGRLMFYNNHEDKPVKVDGTLVVYAFDEEGRKPTDVKPDRKYVFPREQFPAHYSKSKIGHSYSVWVPWDEVGGPTKEMSLIVRFTPVKGSVVVGEQTKHVLSGLPRQEEGPTTSQARQAQVRHSARGPVHPASYQTEATADRPEDADRQADDAANQPRQKKMITTTIDVPSRFGLGTPVATPRPAATAAQGARRGSTARLSPVNRPAAVLQEPQPRRAQTPGGRSRTQTLAQRPARSSHVGPRALGEPIAPRALDRAPFQPHPAGSLSRPQTRPGWAQPSQYGSTSEETSTATN